MKQTTLNRAMLALGRMRQLEGAYKVSLDELVTALHEGWSLDSIGTTPDELRELARGYLIKSAGESLGLMRMAVGRYDTHLGRLRGALAQCEKSLDIVGTSEEELRELGEAARERRRAVSRWLGPPPA